MTMTIRNKKEINKNGIKATGYVTVDAYVNEVAIINGKNGIFFEMPGQRYQDAEGNWQTSYYATPADKEAAAAILQQVKDKVAADDYRKVSFEKRPNLMGFCSVKGVVSAKVSITDAGRIVTPSRKYEKDGETKYANYVGISKEQADMIAAAFGA